CFIKHIAQHIGEAYQRGFQQVRFLSRQRHQVGHHVENKMRTDLRAEELEFSVQFFCLRFFLPFFKTQPVVYKAEYNAGGKKGHWPEPNSMAIHFRELKIAVQLQKKYFHLERHKHHPEQADYVQPPPFPGEEFWV